MGGVIGGGFFSPVIQEHSAQASGEISRSLVDTSDTFIAYQQGFANATLTQGYLPTKSLGISQLSGVIKEQVIMMALSNSLIMFICSIFVLASILLIGKKIAAKQEAS